MRLPGRRTRRNGERATCGCCGRDLPRSAVHELGGTPGVHVCRRCAIWMAVRIGRERRGT